jgi:peptide/nickel transport system substrate-binding protein
VFNNDVGMIVSPAAMDRLGKTGLQTNAVGAGPFLLDSYKPGESLTLKRNPTYWNGPVYLDGIKFIHAGSGDQTLTYLMSGAIQAGYLRDPIPIGKAKDAKLGNSAVVVDSGELLLVNNGVAVTCAGGAPAALCAGKADGTKVPTKTPGSDPKVRQALAAAMDTKALNDRVDQGKATAATGLFDPTFPWNPDVRLPGYDLDKAKQLVSEAKAAGWDGKIRFSCGVEDQTRATEALTVEAMLKGAGIDVDTTRANVTVNESVADVITKKDYDLACWGLQMSPDDSAPTQIDQFLRSTSASNRTGYSNPAMDAALTELQAASTDQTRTAAYKKVALLWSSDVPSVPIFHLIQGVFWNSNVMGMKGTGLTSVVLDKVWLNS